MIGVGIAALGAAVVGGILSTSYAKNATKAAVNAMASGARAVVNTAVDSATKVKDLIQIKSDDKSWSVYKLVDNSDKKNPTVEYIGRTTNIGKRKDQHRHNKYKAALEM